MIDNVLKLLLLLLAASCAPPKHSLCINRDPASGICRDAELRQAERDKASAERAAKAKRLEVIKHVLQVANTQLAEKKQAIAAEQDPQAATRLAHEHDALVTAIIKLSHRGTGNTRHRSRRKTRKNQPTSICYLVFRDRRDNLCPTACVARSQDGKRHTDKLSGYAA